MNRPDRKRMITRDDKKISLSKQCKVLNISRSSIYYQAKAYSDDTLQLMKRMDELFMLYPFVVAGK